MTNEAMDLLSAKVAATKESRSSGKTTYIIVDEEGDCFLSYKPEAGVIHAYKGGSEIALETKDAKAAKSIKPAKATKTSKRVKPEPVEEEEEELEEEELEIPEDLEDLEEEVSPKKSSKDMKTKTKSKVAAKAAAAPKKSAAPAKKAVAKKEKAEPKEPTVIKGTSILAAVKDFIKSGEKKGIVSAGGKSYAINRAASWAVRKTAIEAGKDGIIMAFPDEKGFYLYPKKDHAELFSSIFKSGTYKNIGIYSQSSFPKGHEEDYWNDL